MFSKNTHIFSIFSCAAHRSAIRKLALYKNCIIIIIFIYNNMKQYLYVFTLLGPNAHHTQCLYISADTITISALSVFSASCECNNLHVCVGSQAVLVVQWKSGSCITVYWCVWNSVASKSDSVFTDLYIYLLLY